jgi:hypothetical protein
MEHGTPTTGTAIRQIFITKTISQLEGSVSLVIYKRLPFVFYVFQGPSRAKGERGDDGALF